jgi:hypothetical protein
MVRSEVELVGGVRVVAGGGVGVRSVVETIFLPARRAVRASAWALLALQKPYGKCSWSGMSAHDGSIAGSHAIGHGDVEFELEADPYSKSA